MTAESPVVYALPGTMCDQRLWSRIKSKCILTHCEIPAASNIDRIISALEAQLPKQPVHLMGFSLGGYLASAFCAKHPERVKKLCIIANSPAALPAQEVEQRQQVLQWVSEYSYIGITPSKCDSLLHPDNRQDTATRQLIQQMDEQGGQTMLVQQLGATTIREDLSQRLSELNTPISFIYGDRDNLVKPDLINNIQSQRDNIFTHVVAKSGHMLPLEQPEELSRLLDLWFMEDVNDKW